MVNTKKLKQFKDKHTEDMAIILCNGPSLNDVDFDLIKGHPTFGLNKIYLKDFVPDYYVCVNPLVMQQSADFIQRMPTIKFMAEAWLDIVPDIPDAGQTFILDTSEHQPIFQRDITMPLWEGHTVTYVAMQIAHYMGMRGAVVVGMDHNFGQVARPDAQVRMGSADQYHFDPDYFAGQEWNLPNLPMSEIAYALAAKAFFDDGRLGIVNASTRTKYKGFSIQPLQQVLNYKNGKQQPLTPPDVSAIVSAYKSKDFLAGCIEDLMQQTLYPHDLEIVVVCQKGSPEESYVKSLPGFTKHNQVILTEDIPTVYGAWNIGVKHAVGDYLTNANTDDRRHPRSMEVMASILDVRDDIDLVYHDQFITWEKNQTLAQFMETTDLTKLVGGRFEDEPGYFAWPDYSRGALAEGCFIGPQPMWRAQLHQLHGLFNTEMKSAGDYDFWLRVARADNFFHVPVPLGLYYASKDGIEMSDPLTSQEESWMAVLNNQVEDGVYGRKLDQGVMLRIGSDYGILPRSEITRIMEALA